MVGPKGLHEVMPGSLRQLPALGFNPVGPFVMLGPDGQQVMGRRLYPGEHSRQEMMRQTNAHALGLLVSGSRRKMLQEVARQRGRDGLLLRAPGASCGRGLWPHATRRAHAASYY